MRPQAHGAAAAAPHERRGQAARRTAGPARAAELPTGFRPETIYHESRITLTIARAAERTRPPIVLEESGCRLSGALDARPFSLVLDAPGPAILDRWPGPARAAGDESARAAAGSWIRPVLAAFDRWERELAVPRPTIAAARMEATIARARIAAGTIGAGAPSLAGDERAAVEGRLVLTLADAGRTITIEAARWADGHALPPADLWAGTARAALERGTAMLEALPIPAMEAPVLFEPAAAGVLLHETCGHLLEADHILSGSSPFAAMMGERIAPAEITLLDDPRHDGARVRLDADDEGTRARTNVLVEEGVLRTFLTDRATVRASGGVSTGNARRDSYRHPPLPRMTNLVLRPGSRDPEEMRREIGRGLLVETLGRGQVDPRRGEFRLEVTSGRLIEDGALGRAVASAYIVGSCRALLASIDGVGADVTIDPGAGVCIKDDQIVPVGQAAPSIRASRLRILPGAGA